jgi:hypothetical protein
MHRQSRRKGPTCSPEREHIPIAGALLSTTERAALVTRLDQKPRQADWAAYGAFARSDAAKFSVMC